MSLANYQKYEKYVDSGVDWIGDIPEGWEVKRLRAYFKERKSIVSDKDYLCFISYKEWDSLSTRECFKKQRWK